MSGCQTREENAADMAREEANAIADVLDIAASLPRVSLHIEGRLWFRRGVGGTYHTARIWVNGQHVHTTSVQYGSGDQFLTSAAAWLVNNWFPQLYNPRRDHAMLDTRTLREDLGGTYSVVDVSRQKDL